MTELQKLDRTLSLALRNYQRDLLQSRPDQAISVILRFQGDIAPLEELGFSTATLMTNEAIGRVRLADLSALAAHPNVLRISAGERRRPHLDKATRDIRARASTAGNIGTDGLWFADVNSDTLTAGPGGATGKGVIVAVIDTGIDISHPMFNKAISPHYDSRILRIWDMGIDPQAGEAGPDANLLVSAFTYGVEYKTQAINDALNTSLFPLLPLDFHHRDCEGHGSHVTSIAAGGPTHAPTTDAALVGVAPEADIIMVKLLDTPIFIMDSHGDFVSPDVQFRDAVIYCLRVAHACDKAVVINCSFGNTAGATDGLDDDARWLDETFDPGHAADDLHFPKRSILVMAAGNSGDVTERSYARVTVPDAGHIVVPCRLYENRGPNRTKVENCFRTSDVDPLWVMFWYREVTAPQDVSIAVRVPTEAGFSNPVFAGELHKDFDRGKTRIIRHNVIPPVHRPDGAGGTVTLQRNSMELEVLPSLDTDPPQHAEGFYDVLLTAPPGTVIHVSCSQHGRSYGFDIPDQYVDASVLPPAQVIAGSAAPILPIEVTARSTLDGDCCARNIIAVAAYDDTNLVTGATDFHAIAEFSSRGPTRDFTSPPLGPLSNKPDVAGPGVNINAALSKDTDYKLLHILDDAFLRGDRFDVFSGTSMASPAVAGVVALMLEKHKDLTIDDVRTVLTTHANVRDGRRPLPGDPDYGEAYGSGMIDALKSHAGA